MISPDVATDVIKSITDRGKIGGFMPTFSTVIMRQHL